MKEVNEYPNMESKMEPEPMNDVVLSVMDEKGEQIFYVSPPELLFRAG